MGFDGLARDGYRHGGQCFRRPENLLLATAKRVRGGVKSLLHAGGGDDGRRRGRRFRRNGRRSLHVNNSRRADQFRCGGESNAEAELVDAVQGARHRCAAIIINAAALSHYSWSLHDALATFDGVVVELHLSNPLAREPWRHTSTISSAATGIIAGFRGHGYKLAVEAVAQLLEDRD